MPCVTVTPQQTVSASNVTLTNPQPSTTNPKVGSGFSAKFKITNNNSVAVVVAGKVTYNGTTKTFSRQVGANSTIRINTTLFTAAASGKQLCASKTSVSKA